MCVQYCKDQGARQQIISLFLNISGPSDTTFLAVHKSIPINPAQARALPHSSVFCAVLAVLASKRAVLSANYANYANYAKAVADGTPFRTYCGQPWVAMIGRSASWVQCGGTTAFVRGCLAAGMEGMDLVPGLGSTFFTGLGASTLRSPCGNAGDSSQSANKCSSTAVNPK